jgi:archaemetzincin
MKYALLLFFLIQSSCRIKHPQQNGKDSAITQKKTAEIFIQPLGNIDTAYTSYLKIHISRFYKMEVQILKMTPLPKNAFYNLRNRYKADSLLLFLLTGAAEKNQYIIGVTHRDISTSKGNITDWGVMGLGFMPGKACVISTFRIKNNLRNRQHELERFFKVGLHELGHNFGLGHCPSQHCIMVDAEGKNKLDGEENLCENCRIILQKKGIL